MSDQKKMVVPLHDNVILEKISLEKSEGGIVLPDSLEGSTNEGTVVEVGPGRLVEGLTNMRQPMSVKAGDHVIFSRGAGVEVTFGKKYVILAESDIICKVKVVEESKKETRKLQSV
jgi:chaperonin GroES